MYNNEETKILNDNEKSTQTAQEFVDDLVEKRKELNNYVPRSQFDEVQQKLKAVTERFLNDDRPEREEQTDVIVDTTARIRELRNELYSGNSNDIMSNRNYIAKTMELRNLLIERGEPDPFVPQGNRLQYDENAPIKAQRVADGLQYCLDNSNTDEEFVAKLNSITREPSKFYR